MYWNFTEILRPFEPPFGRLDGTIVVEIGFGNGEYIEHMARTRPYVTVVGIEVSQWCITKTARRALAGGLRNVRLMLGDARYLLRYAFEPGCVSEAYMNFPCPWPKRKHAERRVARPQFVSLIRGRLRVGGSFTLATDVEWYADKTKNVFAADSCFDAGPVEQNPGRDYVTKYERKWREMGRDTFMTRATKIKDGPSDGPEEVGDELEVSAKPEKPELNPGRAKDLGERLSPVIGETIRGERYIAIFRELFLSGDDCALVSVVSVDEGFEQHFYIKVVRTGSCARGKVDSIGHPYKTPGVRACLRHIAHKTGVVF
jgi:tRNA (guanine-N7-)-methyltransferase